jgi:transcriptional regulator with PAS, ATPase and Fis domain
MSKSGTASDLAVIKRHRETLERNLIQRVLANHAYRRCRAAKELGISRMALYEKMKKYGLVQAQRGPALATCL